VIFRYSMNSYRSFFRAQEDGQRLETETDSLVPPLRTLSQSGVQTLPKGAMAAPVPAAHRVSSIVATRQSTLQF
jgi:hypothetical protein